MVKRKKIRVLAWSLVLCAALCGCADFGGSKDLLIGRERQEGSGEDSGQKESGERESSGPDAAAPEQTDAPQFMVHVCGAVQNPGVVSLPEGSRAQDALEAAGGFTENAARDSVNLADWVYDGQKLYVPAAEEAEGLVGQEVSDGRVNINTADISALCSLPGIGESRARDIIAYREENGAFASCEDIMKVSGIKSSVYNRISGKIRVK